MPENNCTIELIELTPVKRSCNSVSLVSSSHILPSQIMGLRGLPGVNGEPGKQGIQGPAGLSGRDGVDGRDGSPGLRGEQGMHGRDGVDGKDGKGISSIKFGPGLSWVLIRWSDGTEETIQCEKPAGTVDDPKWSLDGLNDLYRVKDILAGFGIVVSEDDFGNFTIELSKFIDRVTVTSSRDALATDKHVTIDASSAVVTYNLSPLETDGRELDIYCIDSTNAVTLTGVINGSTNPTMAQYDSYRITYNAGASLWELR